MLERVAVVAYVAVGVVVVDHEVAVVGEDVGRGEVARRELHLLGPQDLEHLAGVVGQVAPCLVAQVGRGGAVARDLDRIVHADGAVVGGDDDRVAPFGQQPQDREEVGVLEPRAGERAERGVVLGRSRITSVSVRACEGCRGELSDHRESASAMRPMLSTRRRPARGVYELVERPLPVLLP